MPSAGINSVAILFPSVMVPVLSSSKTSVSPAASIALPLVAITFFLRSRSIPLMPIALSNPPIVVGIRQTRSEIRTGKVRLCVLKHLKLSDYSRNMPAKRRQPAGNIIVRPDKRIINAISFGVFCRFAPSTSAIIRSRKVLPGSDVTLM